MKVLPQNQEIEVAQKIENFDIFKKFWIETLKFVKLHENQSTENAWNDYKVIKDFMNIFQLKYNFKNTKNFDSSKTKQIKYSLNFSVDEDVNRFRLFEDRWTSILEKNRKFIVGENYYPHLSDIDLHLTESEIDEDELTKYSIDPLDWEVGQPFEKI